jgi:hypothetical protein
MLSDPWLTGLMVLAGMLTDQPLSYVGVMLVVAVKMAGPQWLSVFNRFIRIAIHVISKYFIKCLT